MTTHDRQGREYAKLSNLKAGDIVELDSGFECTHAGQVTLLRGQGHLYFTCRLGRHNIINQLTDDKDHLVGIYGAIQRKGD